jgi:transcription elongation factor GreA
MRYTIITISEAGAVPMTVVTPPVSLIAARPSTATTLGSLMPGIHRLTQDTYDRLHAELEDLRTRGRIDIARAIEAARALGDLSENGDYHAAKDSQGKMEARVRQLEAMLLDAEVVDSRAGADGEVATGVIVSLRYVGDDDIERFLIGSIEERREGVSVVSPNSPLGQALMGHKEGDQIAYDAPSGPLEVEIVKVGS